MFHAILRRVSVAACLAGLALAGEAARADDGKITPAQIDKNAGQVELAYPMDAQVRGEEGSIDFALYLSAGGHPTGKFKLMKSTGFADLDDAAIQSAMAWHYLPARTADGDTTSAWLPLHLEFRLPKPPAAGVAQPSSTP